MIKLITFDKESVADENIKFFICAIAKYKNGIYVNQTIKSKYAHLNLFIINSQIS
jgi:hypothetical protein